ncbi:hypothetical protein [Belnapia rosea]|uniref:hypothetical protein n=1 Tax=Belnapia rosea TaxID=938405 RepID=UPI00088D2041|nr:hypothetical protein [Belnapia rosea]SDB74109.1 hypothetical protein SAMN02927895_05040 [Belnapia rosea]
MSFRPYAEEAAAFQIGDLTIENRLDRVALFGSLDLTRDKVGLQHARMLRDLLAAVVTELERPGIDLSEATKTASTDTIKNPFG